MPSTAVPLTARRVLIQEAFERRQSSFSPSFSPLPSSRSGASGELALRNAQNAIRWWIEEDHALRREIPEPSRSFVVGPLGQHGLSCQELKGTRSKVRSPPLHGSLTLSAVEPVLVTSGSGEGMNFRAHSRCCRSVPT